MPGGLADELASLPHLTALELRCAESALPPLAPLATLPRLRRLALADRGGCNHGAVLHPPAPASFAGKLLRYRWERSCGWLQVRVEGRKVCCEGRAAGKRGLPACRACCLQRPSDHPPTP